MRASRAVLAIPILLALTGCSAFAPGRRLFIAPRVVTVDVINQNASDAVVHALYDRRRHLLGTAPADSTHSYRFPWDLGGRALRSEFVLAADVRRCSTELGLGDAGDGFYVVVAGTAEVVGDGRPVTCLGPGDSFGEIALLRRVPRTATVRAIDELRLESLRADRFLALMTGSPRGNAATSAHVDEMLDRFAPRPGAAEEPPSPPPVG
jgi:CRP-like cAMP-binding protein